MKKIITTLIVPFVLFGFELSFNKKFEKDVTPDKILTYITITANKKTEAEISPKLEKYNKYISNNDEVEKKAGEFSIRPKYKYNKGKSTLLGYTGILKYTIYTKKSYEINRFIKSILKLKKDSDISISVGGLSWIVSKKKHSDVIEQIRLELILWAKNYSLKLSNETNSICTVKKINVNSHAYNRMYKAARSEVLMRHSDPSNIPVPQLTQNTVSLTPSYVLDCK